MILGFFIAYYFLLFMHICEWMLCSFFYWYICKIYWTVYWTIICSIILAKGCIVVVGRGNCLRKWRGSPVISVILCRKRQCRQYQLTWYLLHFDFLITNFELTIRSWRQRMIQKYCLWRRLLRVRLHSCWNNRNVCQFVTLPVNLRRVWLLLLSCLKRSPFFSIEI